MKVCYKCQTEKRFEEFHRRKASKDGLQARCKVCDRAHTRTWQKANPEEAREYSRRWREENLEKARERVRRWREENPEEAREYSRRWAKANRERTSALSAKRRAKKLQRTPSWADQEAIQVYYDNARWLAEVTGKEYHVDHVIPLQGEEVSGLHVETNLRIIPAEENLRKGNKF